MCRWLLIIFHKIRPMSLVSKYIWPGHSPGEPGKPGKVRESVFLHMVNYYWVLILTQNVQKRNYLLGKVVHHMKSERRTDAYCARCKLCLKTFSLSNVGKQTVVSHAKSSGHVRNVAEKSGNLITTGQSVATLYILLWLHFRFKVLWVTLSKYVSK